MSQKVITVDFRTALKYDKTVSWPNLDHKFSYAITVYFHICSYLLIFLLLSVLEYFLIIKILEGFLWLFCRKMTNCHGKNLEVSFYNNTLISLPGIKLYSIYLLILLLLILQRILQIPQKGMNIYLSLFKYQNDHICLNYRISWKIICYSSNVCEIYII